MCVCADTWAWAYARALVVSLIQHTQRMRLIVICGLWLHHIFRRYLINGAIFGKKRLQMKCAFRLSVQLVSEKISHSEENTARYFYISADVPVILRF